MDINLIRRENLQKFIDECFGGNVSKLAERVNKTKPIFYNILNGKKSAGEKFLRGIELELNLEAGFFDKSKALPEYYSVDDIKIPRYEIKASAGDGELIIAENITGYTVYDKSILAKYNTKQENLAIVTVTGKSMMPTLYEDEEILIDLSKKDRLDNRLFVISTRNELWVKRMRITPNGYILESDNEDYRYLDHLYNDTTTVRVVGLVLRSLGRDV